MTHTYAELAVSPATHAEIKALLQAAGYGHALAYHLPFQKRGEKMRAYWVLAEFYQPPMPRVLNNPFDWRKTA